MNDSKNPLKNRNFKLLFIGEGISVLGDQFAMIALPWLVLQLTGSSVALGTVLALMAIPRAIFMIFGGAIVDKFSPRNVMIFSNTARMIFVGALTFLVFTDLIQLWWLFIFALLFGLTDAFYFPAQSALVPELVTKDQLHSANSWIQGTAQFSTLIGPAIAGLIISAFTKSSNPKSEIIGIGIALLMDTLSFLATIVCAYLIHVEKPTHENQENFLGLIKEGAKYVWHNEMFRIIFILVAFTNLFIVGPFMVGIPVFADRYLPEGAAAYGIITGAFGAGSLLGIVLTTILPKVKGKYFGPFIMTLFGLQAATLAIMPFGQTTSVVSLISFVMGVLGGYSNLIAFTWLQKKIPEKLMGRVISLIMFASVGLIPVSSFVSGFILNIDLKGLFVGGGLLTFILSLITAFLPATRKMGEED